MPAWGETDNDIDSWKLVHSIRHLPEITPRELDEMGALNPRAPDDHEVESGNSIEHHHSAHVMVSPSQAKTGAAQKYEVRVHNEGKIAASSIDLEIPEGVTVLDCEASVRQLYREEGRSPHHVSDVDGRCAA